MRKSNTSTNSYYYECNSTTYVLRWYIYQLLYGGSHLSTVFTLRLLATAVTRHLHCVHSPAATAAAVAVTRHVPFLLVLTAVSVVVKEFFIGRTRNLFW